MDHHWPRWAAVVVTALLTLTACGQPVTTPSPSAPGPTVSPTPQSPAPRTSNVGAPGPAPTIVIDPGHSPAITATDPATGLDVSGYVNEPEMHDVFAVAVLVKAKLEASGYRVVMTKNQVTDRIDQAKRAAIANNTHAALALSIHDQAGRNGGIGFNQGNNTVYYQSVGTYRATPRGKRIYFTDRAVAATSARYGQVFGQQRTLAEGHQVAVRGDVGYDLGSRELAPGNIWIVQLLSKVPWIYNEAGGNSAGMIGLSAADKDRYANGLVAAVEHCVPSH
ncbi:N-acetylmuramoyl-L-alanine amidase family protein [Fodinicola acaciae]|uniref:N-acetylmuramoyl-L-alanine amidase family protein n=1 Tax=Fodinicola acaciae TaxID=2681555 RepID=UPI0013D50AAB|nr:N-acetylmuramoyl-L-alanine amidase [Fodinicola acaciae]